MAPAGDRFDSDCVVGTQFESSQPHHAVLRKQRFPGLLRIAPNWREFVRAFVSADDRLNVTDRFAAVVSAPKIPFPGSRDRTTTLRPSNYPLRIAFLSGYNSRDEGSNVSANRAAETGRKGRATTP
jgi:hypothetical protein